MKGLYTLIILMIYLSIIIQAQDRGNVSKTIKIEGTSNVHKTNISVSELVLDTKNQNITLINNSTKSANSEGWVSLSPPIIQEKLNDVHTFNENTAITVGNGGSIYRTTNKGIDWLKITSSTINDLYSLFFLNENKGWIVGANGIILKTEDGGITWILLSTELYSLLDVQFIDSNVGWAITGSKIYKSIDGGNTWIEKFTSLEATYFFGSIKFSNANTGIAVGNGKLYRTTDGGETWNKIDIGGATWMYDVNSINSDHWWISGLRASNITITVGGLFGGVSITIDNPWQTLWESTDAGATWTQKDLSIAGSLMNVYFIDSTTGLAVGTNGTVLKTLDGGMTWNLTKSPHNMNAVNFKDSQNGWAVGTDGTIIHSNDGGNTWIIQSGNGTNSSLYVTHFLNSQTGWVAGASGKILKTTNGGDLWMEQNSNGSKTLSSIFFLNDQKGYAIDSWGDNFRYTTNGGNSWNNINFFKSYKLNEIFFVDSQNGWIVGENGVIIKTTSGSTSRTGWIAQNSNTSKNLNSIHFVDSQNGWAVGDSAIIIKTTDGGNTWLPQSANIEKWDNDLFSVHFTSKTTGFIVGNSKILYTTDGGLKWTVQSYRDVATGSINFADEQIGCIVGSSGTILRTIDGGKNWGLQKSGTTKGLVSVRLIDDKNGYIVGLDGTILKTTDGGGKIYYPPNIVSPENESIDESDEIILRWKSVENVKSYQLQISKVAYFNSSYDNIVDEQALTETSYKLKDLDYNTTYYWRLKSNYEEAESQWSSVNKFTTKKGNWFAQVDSLSSINLADVYFLNKDLGWVVGTGYSQSWGAIIYKTTDGGDHWKFKYILQDSYLNKVHFLNENIGFAIGNNGVLMKTIDGGETWNLINVGTQSTLYDLVFVNSTNGWIIGSNSTIIKTTDGGKNWTTNSFGHGDWNKGFFLNDKIGYAGWSGTYKTIDGGNSWNFAFNLPRNSNSIWFFDENTGISCGGGWYDPIVKYYAPIYKTYDAGKTWVKKTDSLTYSLHDLFFIDKKNGWAVGALGRVCFTTNGGETWNEQKTLTTEQLKSVFFTDSNTGWAVCQDKILKTNNGGLTSIDNYRNGIIPNGYSLSQNYPNPFNSNSRIKFEIIRSSQVKLTVYDIHGREVGVLVDKELAPGSYEAIFNAENLPNGIYYYRIQVGNFSEGKEMILVN
jgi:photosystem II stability/assembly factor-like uncharacterized protein